MHGRQGQTQDQAGDDRHLVGFEDVGGHAGAVTDVVTDQVGDHGRVARVIFFHTGFDLADQVSADIGGLGVDAAADAHEQRQQRAAESETEQDIRRGLAKDNEDEGAAQQPQAVGQHAGDRAGAISNGQRLLEAAPRGRRDAHVTLHGHVHADEADHGRECRAHDEGQGTPGQRPTRQRQDIQPWPPGVRAGNPCTRSR